MRGDLSTGRKRHSHPYDWYVDECWVAMQLYRALGGFAAEKAAGEAIWDPSAGLGNTIEHLQQNGHVTFASDIVERIDYSLFSTTAAPLPQFFSADFLETTAAPARCSIVFNPPYSYIKGISEAFVRHALKLSSRRVCAVLPVKWLTSQARFHLFTDHPPQAVMILSQRPSMPPGDMIAAMGNRAFNGGVVDYAWFVWDVTRPTPRHETRTIWLPPLDRPDLHQTIQVLA